MKKENTGSCLCGAVSFEISGKPLRVTHCHCRNCQKAAGAAFMTFATFRTENVKWTGDRPTTYPSSDTGERGFCAKCGSALTFRHLEHDDMISIAAGCLDDPDAVAPRVHIWVKSRMNWLKLADGLPEYQEWRPKK